MKTATRNISYYLTTALALTLVSYALMFSHTARMQPVIATAGYAESSAFETASLATDEVNITTLGVTGRSR